MEFPCSKCGLCCRIAALVPELLALEYVGPDGCCIHLDRETGLCGIYEIRPFICDFNLVYKAYAPEGMTEELFLRLSAVGCNQLMTLTGITDKLINIELIKDNNARLQGT